MHSHRLALATLTLAFTFAAGAASAAAPAAAQKPIKTVVNSVRYGKYDLAAKQLAFPEMVTRLLGDHLGKFTPEEQKELSAGLETIIRAKSFPKGKEMFEHLDNIIYSEPRDESGDPRCKTTIVVLRNYKKAEIVIDWVLTQKAGAYTILDIVMMGESTLIGIREDQVEPLLKEGGAAAVMKAMRTKVAEISGK
ncbi:MAG: ABC transporter substrate-binding protein [Deltaproteobacteria bacterium]|nr:ABC transporter substrate-binding protein [Deltaproteobacteria bacterium]